MTSSKPFRLPAGLPRIDPPDIPAVYLRLRSFFGHQDWWPGETPFEVMVGAILTQNTAWANVERAVTNLKRARCLTPAAMRKLPVSRLAMLIRPAGYFNVKARRLKNFVDFLFEKYGGRPARMRRERGKRLRTALLSVSGIGPETADSILLYALDKPFFVIDAYTKRIFGRHRTYRPEKDYGEWQALFSGILTRWKRSSRARLDVYNDFHAQIVALGKTYCRTRPRCRDCPLRASICPAT